MLPSSNALFVFDAAAPFTQDIGLFEGGSLYDAAEGHAGFIELLDSENHWLLHDTIRPILRKLDDGTVAMTYGRYGAKVMFADAGGLRWSVPSTIYNGPGSG